MRDWTSEIPPNVQSVRVKYLVTRFDGHNRRNYTMTFDVLADAEEASQAEGGPPIRRRVTVTHIE